MSNAVVWGIHAGKTGDAESLFMQKKVVAVGWEEIGDLTKIKPDRDAFKQRVAEVYPGKTTGSVANNAGQLYRFVHEMKEGDYVVYPSKADRMINIGIVKGAYSFQAGKDVAYPNRRMVDWLKKLPRTNFTQGALYEIGSAMSLFQVKTYAEEFLVKVKASKDLKPPLPAADITVAQVAESIEENTRDFVIKQLSQELKGHPFADFVAHLLSTMGYRTRVSPEGPDGGVDIIAHKDELGFEPPIIKVQVKSTSGSISDPTVSALYGKISTGEFGLVVTLGTFTQQAKAFARSKSNLRLIDGVELVELTLAHYEQFDGRYKGLRKRSAPNMSH